MPGTRTHCGAGTRRGWTTGAAGARRAGGAGSGAGLALRGRAELTEQVTHPFVRPVAVRDELGLGLVVEVAGDALAVLDSLAVGGDGVGDHLRGGQALAEGLLERTEAVLVHVQAGL